MMNGTVNKVCHEEDDLLRCLAPIRRYDAKHPRRWRKQNAPGELVVDPPTLINLGFEWMIEGDDNRSAKVEVSYRRQGEAQWKQGLPLLRLQGEQIYQGQGVFDVVSPNMFAGSIFDLEPDTPYEARFVLTDPDGLTWTRRKSLHQDRKRSHPA